MVPWLRSHGYSPSQAGLVVAVVFGAAMAANPILGSISDRVAAPGRMITAAIIIGAAAFAAMPLAVTSFPLLVVLAGVYAVTVASLPGVLDSWILSRREEVPGLQYGIARGMGSLGFAGGGIVLGSLTDTMGIGVMFPSFVITTGIAAVLTWIATRRFVRERRERDASQRPHRDQVTQVPDPLAPEVPSGMRNSRFVAALRAVASNRPYLVLIAGAFLGFSGLRAGLTFLPYLFDEVGGTVGQVGLAHSIGALSEIPFFMGSAILHRRVRGARLISFVLVLFGVRLLAYTWIPTPGGILALQLSHGLTFGIFMATTVDYIHRIAPPEHRAFFQTIGPATFFGAGSIVGSWIGGLLMEATSVVWLYRIAAVIALIGAPIPLFAGPADPDRRR